MTLPNILIADALPHREHQVFRLLAVGKSVCEIGAQPGQASNTASTYRLRIPEKTGTQHHGEPAFNGERHVKAPAGA
jgi:DNA-binding NarL/FixJ family response regulator